MHAKKNCLSKTKTPATPPPKKDDNKATKNKYDASHAYLNTIEFAENVRNYLNKPKEQFQKKNSLRGFKQGPTQNRLYSKRRWLKAQNFGLRKYRDCTIYVAKTKLLISCTAIVQLICAFIFACEKTTGFLLTLANREKEIK